MAFGGGYSPNVPGLRTMFRVINTYFVRRFKGMNTYSNITEVGPDTAISCQNVICSSSGELQKLHYPVPVTPAVDGLLAGPDRFYDFQRADGLRQVLAFDAISKVFYYDTTGAFAYHLVDDKLTNAGLWDVVTANNIAFCANGKRMMKWTGGKWQVWGHIVPAAFPSVGLTLDIASISITANVATITLKSSATNGGLFIAKVGSTVRVSGFLAGNVFFNGYFAVVSSVVAEPASFTFALVHADVAAILNTGQVTLLALDATAAIDHVQAANGVGIIYSATGFLPNCLPKVGEQFTVTGLAVVVQFNDTGGSFKTVRSVDTVQGIVTFYYSGPDIPKTADTGTFAQGNADATPFSWGYAYGNSVTGHIGSMSPGTPTNLYGFFANSSYILNAVAPTDSQLDTIYWYRTLEGGSLYYLHSTTTYNAAGATALAQGLQLISHLSDSEMTTSVVAQIQFNNPPLVGSNLSVFQGRVFVSGIVGSPQDIIYSGYEYIFTGRPEESFPPFNRLRLAIGADAIKGHGVIQAGVVAFSKSNQMYMFRGIVEDITTTAPLLYSAYLEELPWKLGAYNHQSIASTPYGLVWFAADKTVQVYDGANQPICISGAVSSFLRDITSGQEGNVRGKYIKWLDRDWYCLSFAWANGVNNARNNTILVFDLNTEPALNTGAFLFSLEADDIGIIEDPITGRRRLCISNFGVIQEILIVGDAINGISKNSIPATNNQLSAWWQGGYFGQETPQTRKMARWARLKSDVTSVGLMAFMVNDEEYDFSNPLIKALRNNNNKYSINQKTKRISVMITFPNQDVSASVQELQVNLIPTGDY